MGLGAPSRAAAKRSYAGALRKRRCTRSPMQLCKCVIASH